jgi:hypothetical protein
MKQNNYGSNYLSEADLPYAIYFKKDNLLLAESEFHESIEFIFVIEGSVRIYIGDEDELLTPGMISYSPSFIRHHYIQKSDKILLLCLVPLFRILQAIPKRLSFQGSPPLHERPWPKTSPSMTSSTAGLPFRSATI